MSFNLSGQTAVIYGDAGSLGIQLAYELAGRGADIILLTDNAANLSAAASEIRKYNVRCLLIQYEFNDRNSVKEAVETVEEMFHKIDILINIAVFTGGYPCRVQNIYQITQECGRVMRKNKYGRILNITSRYGLIGNTITPAVPFQPLTGRLMQATRVLAGEWAKYGITVNTICPGYIATRSEPSFCQMVQGEISATVAYLVSPDSSFLTGLTIPVKGGFVYAF